MTVEAVDRPFARVTRDERVRWGWEGTCGVTGCRTAGFAYTGSNPGPATTSELRNYSGVTRLRHGPFYQPSISFYHPTKPALLMGRTSPR